MKNKFFYDILRDKGSKKYSITKVSALIVLFIIVVYGITGIVIMIIKKQIDHLFFAEFSALILVLLGYKNAIEYKNYLPVNQLPEIEKENDKIDNEEEKSIIL